MDRRSKTTTITEQEQITLTIRGLRDVVEAIDEVELPRECDKLATFIEVGHDNLRFLRQRGAAQRSEVKTLRRRINGARAAHAQACR